MNRWQGPNTYRTPLRGARERFVSARDREGERAPPATPAVNSCFTTSAGRSAPPRHSPGNHSKKDAKSFLARMATDIRHHRGISGFPRPRPLPLSGEKLTSIPFPRMRRRDASSAHKPSGENQDVDAPSLPLETWVREEEAPSDRRPATAAAQSRPILYILFTACVGGGAQEKWDPLSVQDAACLSLTHSLCRGSANRPPITRQARRGRRRRGKSGQQPVSAR